MPVVHVEMLAGRSVEQKRVLARELTESVNRAIGAAPESIWIIISEVPSDQWATAGELVIDRTPR